MSPKENRFGKRPYSTLTPDHRQYLAGIIEKEGNTENKAREKIRGRILESIYDLQMLFYHLEERDVRQTFQEDFDVQDGPIEYEPIRDNVGFIGTGYGEKLGYPAEGDLAKGYDGKSVIQAGIEHLVETNPGVSKASPALQCALTDAVAFLCRASEAGQLNVWEVIERGMEKYHRIHTEERKIVTVTEEIPHLARADGLARIWDDKRLTRGQMRALKRDAYEQMRKGESPTQTNIDALEKIGYPLDDINPRKLY